MIHENCLMQTLNWPYPCISLTHIYLVDIISLSISVWKFCTVGILVSASSLWCIIENKTHIVLLLIMWPLIMYPVSVHLPGISFFPTSLPTSLFWGKIFLISPNISVFSSSWCMTSVPISTCHIGTTFYHPFMIWVLLNRFPGTQSCIESLKVIQSKPQSMTKKCYTVRRLNRPRQLIM